MNKPSLAVVGHWTPQGATPASPAAASYRIGHAPFDGPAVGGPLPWQLAAALLVGGKGGGGLGREVVDSREPGRGTHTTHTLSHTAMVACPDTVIHPIPQTYILADWATHILTCPQTIRHPNRLIQMDSYGQLDTNTHTPKHIHTTTQTTIHPGTNTEPDSPALTCTKVVMQRDIHPYLYTDIQTNSHTSRARERPPHTDT